MRSATSCCFRRRLGRFAGAWLACLVLGGCLPDYSPWQTDVPAGMRDWNARHLARLAERQVPGDTFRVVLVSDPQKNPGALASLVQIVNGRPDLDQIAFVAVLGDLTDYGLLAEYVAVQEALEELAVPCVALIGNHDAISHGKAIFREMFGPYDFWFDYRGTRFIAYNSNSYEFAGVPDLDFVAEATVGFAQRPHTVGLTHVPWLNDATAAEQSAYRQFLVDHGIRDLVTGHLHKFGFEVWPEGLTQFQVDKVGADRLHYGVMTVAPEGIAYERCTADGCQPAQGAGPRQAQ